MGALQFRKHIQSFNYLLQLLLTMYWISLPIEGILKVLVLIFWWLLTFWPLKISEILVFIVPCVLYSIGNILSVQKGVFFFKHPDVMGLPYYEYGMWGFYFLHTIRVLKPFEKIHFQWRTIPIAIVFSASFSFSADPQIVPLLSFSTLGILLIFYHSIEDIRFMSYFVLFGMLLEIIGVLSGQWGYPPPHEFAVAPWFFCLFAGSGILCYRIAVPLLTQLQKSLFLKGRKL
jgi:hypothetical protein